MGPFPSNQSQQLQPPGSSGPVTSNSYGPGSAYPIWKRQTAIQPMAQSPTLNTFAQAPVTPTPILPLTAFDATEMPIAAEPTTKPRLRARIVALVLLCLLVAALYFVWNGAGASSASNSSSGNSITQQNFSSTTKGGTTSGSSTGSVVGTIQVYITGAVKHPGVYTLAQGARVHDLLSAAGGPLPQANLVALNLVAKLSDGQEVYVTVQGETPPNYVGGVSAPGSSNTGNTATTSCVNVNTATADDLRLNLHLSSTSAQSIINYRLQHGDYQSVQELSNVVSKSIYDKIKGTACVS